MIAHRSYFSVIAASALVPFLRCSMHNLSFDFSFLISFFDFAEFKSLLMRFSFFSSFEITFSNAFLFLFLFDLSESITSQSRSTIFFIRILLCLFHTGTSRYRDSTPVIDNNPFPFGGKAKANYAGSAVDSFRFSALSSSASDRASLSSSSNRSNSWASRSADSVSRNSSRPVSARRRTIFSA